MKLITDYVNDNDDFVSGFNSYTCLGDNIYNIFENEDKIIT